MILEQLKAELAVLQSKFDPSYMYSDDFSFYSEQTQMSGRIAYLKSEIKKLENT